MSRLFIVVALVLAGGAAVRAMPPPQSFVAGVYAAYARQPTADPLGDDAGSVFTPSLLALIRADQRFDGEAGKLDYDPLCDCQDADGLRLLAVDAGRATAGRVHVTSRFRISATVRTVDLTLAWTPQGWRIDDVTTARMKSLRRFLSGNVTRRTRG